MSPPLIRPFKTISYIFPARTKVMCFSSRTIPYCLFKMAPSKANLPLSPANGSRSMILPPNIVENPTYHVRTDSLKPLQSPVIAPHSPDMGVWGFPLTSGLCSCQLHLSPSVELGGGGGAIRKFMKKPFTKN